MIFLSLAIIQFHNYILMVMVLRYLFFDVNSITIFKSDVTMMKYAIRVKPL